MYIRPITLPDLRALPSGCSRVKSVGLREVGVQGVAVLRVSLVRFEPHCEGGALTLSKAAAAPLPDTRPLADLGDAVPVGELMAICREAGSGRCTNTLPAATRILQRRTSSLHRWCARDCLCSLEWTTALSRLGPALCICSCRDT